MYRIQLITHQEPGRLVMNKKRCQHHDLPDKDLKASMIKMFQQGITNSPATNKEVENLSKVQFIKRTKKLQIWKITEKNCWIDLIVEWRWEEIESMNLKISRIYSMWTTEKIDWRKKLRVSQNCGTIRKELVFRSLHPRRKGESETKNKLKK